MIGSAGYFTSSRSKGKVKVMEVSGDSYRAQYVPERHVVRCEGAYSLDGVEEYGAISQLLNEAATGEHETLTLDLRDLTFLNSSGINILSRFVIAVRRKGEFGLRVLGSRSIPWQTKSLINFQRLMPALVLEFEEGAS
jgi:hypothetical protein